MRIRIEGETEVITVNEPNLAEEIAACICAYMMRDVQVTADNGDLHHEFFSTQKEKPSLPVESVDEWVAITMSNMTRH